MISSQIEGMVFSKRMHVGSYRQNIRLMLYSLLLLVVENKNKETLNGSFMEKAISAIESEKDPRNMVMVLQIYYYFLANTQHK